MKSRILLILPAAATVMLSFITFAAASFNDVLDTPALKNRHAEKTLLISVATAGKRVVGVGQHGHIVYSDDRARPGPRPVFR
ncbi:hypothetical protein [Geotalea toluenoxydans]|uniref:hypothetical protein n=1 Tax=Geotalea toluenoxydans TaxID=421624 RepID=UPI000A698703|nr:hypothetical protein [Geotalea toluenoxydans]